MRMKWEKKLDLMGPIDQAGRCLEQWLREEKRFLSARQRRRAAALMARYFQHEDEVTDALMLSFLRHYSGKQALDMEDPACVRQEIKAVLDKSSEKPPVVLPRWSYAFAALAAVMIVVGWGGTHRKITRAEQAELKSLVHEVDALDPTMTSAAIWNSVKAPLQVRRYEDMTWWDYWQSRRALEDRRDRLRHL